MLSSANKKALR